MGIVIHINRYSKYKTVNKEEVYTTMTKRIGMVISIHAIFMCQLVTFTYIYVTNYYSKMALQLVNKLNWIMNNKYVFTTSGLIIFIKKVSLQFRLDKELFFIIQWYNKKSVSKFRLPDSSSN